MTEDGQPTVYRTVTPFRWEQHTANQQAVLERILSNDEGLKNLRIVQYSSVSWKRIRGRIVPPRDCLDFQSVMRHIQRFPNTLRDALRSNTAITSVEIQTQYYFNDGVYDDEVMNEPVFLDNWGRPSEVLARAIGAMSSVRHLTITCDQDTFGHTLCGRKEYRDRIVSSFLRFLPQITTLCLRANAVTQGTAAMWDRAFASCQHSTLEILHYEIIDDEESTMEEHFPIPTSLSSLPKLRTIHMESHRCDDGGPLTLLSFPVLPISELSGLQNIKFTDVEFDDETAVSLARTLETGRHPNLTTIHVHDCPANAMFFAGLADIAKNLTELKIEASYDLDDNYRVVQDATYALGLSRLLTRLKASSSLKVLSIQRFVWGEEDLGLLGNLLDESLLALESLSLDIAGEGFNDGTFVSLAATLGRNASLKHLCLDSCCEEELPISVEGMHRAHTELFASPSLSSYECGFGLTPCYPMLCELIQMLDFQTSLRKLVYKGAHRPLEMEKKEWEKKLLNILRTNYTLTHLEGLTLTHLEGRTVRSNMALEKQIVVILTLNSHGRRYMMEDRGAKGKGVALLAEIAARRIPSNRYPYTDDLRLDCLFFHLSENPSLCDPNP